MANAKRQRVQIEIPEHIRIGLNTVIAKRDIKLVTLLLIALKKEVEKDDPKLAKLIGEELKTRPSRGRPPKTA